MVSFTRLILLLLAPVRGSSILAVFLVLGVLVPGLLAPSLGAQMESVVTREHELDSGPMDNPTALPARLFSAEVSVPDALWIRLYLDGTELPGDSQLRLTSGDDGAQQYFDARSLEDYKRASAVFNGDRVLVEILAGPNTRGNRLSVNKLEMGSSSYLTADSICGSGDDRVFSTDQRVARAHSSGCTVWLVNEHTFVAAGHCSGTKSSMAHFNVPLSNGAGLRRFPPPGDQYALDLSTLRSLDNGIGKDWAVVSSVRNSNHHLYAGQKQGSWFKLGTIPPNFNLESVRLTGYGSVSPPLSRSLNWAQKSQVGPGVSTTPSSINYRADTTDGNSGSPVILESTGEVIGIHTHGGCVAFGGSNTGTRIDNPDLQAAIQEVMASKVAGEFSLFGEGCAGTFGSPRLSMTGVPDTSATAHVSVLWVPPGEVGVLAVGFSNTEFESFGLPMAMDAFGMEGCTLYTRPDIQIPVSTGIGVVSFPLHIPNDPALVNLEAFLQYVGPDEGATNTLRAISSNAARIFVGG